MIMTKLCSKCKNDKNINDFGWKKGKNGKKKSSWCKSCCSQDSSVWRQKQGKLRAKTELSARVQRISASIKKQNSPISSKFIREMYSKQNGCCFYTGVKMKLMSDIKNDPLIMSIDKIDPKKEYIETNVVLCCLGINHLKGRHTIEQLYNNLRLFYESAMQNNKFHSQELQPQ